MVITSMNLKQQQICSHASVDIQFMLSNIQVATKVRVNQKQKEVQVAPAGEKCSLKLGIFSHLKIPLRHD